MIRLVSRCVCAVLLCTARDAIAQTAATAPRETVVASDSAARAPARGRARRAAPELASIRYVKTGLPARRGGGGTRGVPVVRLLAPHDHMARTAHAQPVLYWLYSPGPGVEPRRAMLVLENGARRDSVALPLPTARGEQRVAFADVGLRLRPGVAYRWIVSLEGEVGGWDDNTWLQLAAPARPLSSTRSHDARRLASAGLWYDAFADLSASVVRQPADSAALELRCRFVRETTTIELPRRSCRAAAS